MNEKKAKALRKAAGYKNQSKTPGTMPFPGIARAYRVPVYAKHEVKRTAYERFPDGTVEKVVHKTMRITHAGGKPVLEMEIIPPGKEAIEFDDEGKPTKYNEQTIVRPKFELYPVPKPGRLNTGEPKGIYRALKKLDNSGALTRIGPYARNIINSMEVTT